MSNVILGLGANLGEREANLRTALVELSGAVTIDRVSSLYESEPVGYHNQPWFLNAVCIGATDLPAQDLLIFCKDIERRLGRKPGIRFGPREIDIDILFYDDMCLNTPDLQLPHPRLAERAFVLLPLAELEPDLKHPATGLTVAQMLANLPSAEEVRLKAKDWLAAESRAPRGNQ